MADELTDDLILLLIHNHVAGKELSDRIEPGLRLKLGKKGARWSLLFAGERTEKIRVGIGAWPCLGAAEAREQSQAIKQSYKRAAKRDRDDACTSILLEDYRSRRLSSLRCGSETYRALAKLAYALGFRYVWALQTGDIAPVIEAISRSAPVQAARTLAYAKAMFSWAIEQGYTATNPASKVPKPRAGPARSRILAPPELGAIWEAADLLSSRVAGYPFGHIVRLLILTGARTHTVGGMRVDELDLPPGSVGGTWKIGASRSASGRPESIPLRRLGRRIIEDALPSRLSNDFEFVFSTDLGRPVSGWSSTKVQLDRLMTYNPIPPWRFDDLRRTFNTFIAQVGPGDDARQAWGRWVEKCVT